jgi:prolyl oligopeptidase
MLASRPRFWIIASFIGLSAQAAEPGPPVAAVKPVTESYFGVEVTDPYRYMEDPSTSEVQQWAKAESEFTRAALDAIPGRKGLLARIAELDASSRERIIEIARLPGEVYFYEKRGPQDNQFKLYVRHGLSGAEKLLIDPESLAKRLGQPYAITFYAPSDSGRYVAYGLSAGGSEEASIHLLEVATLKELIEPIDRAHYSGANWLPDDSGFFYLRQRSLPAGTPDSEKYRFQTAFFHRLRGHGPDPAIIQAGVSKSMEISPEDFPLVFSQPGTPYVIAMPQNGVQRERLVYITRRADVFKPGVKWRKLFGREDEVTSFAIRGDDLYLLTHKDAPRYKLIRTSVMHPDLAHASVLVAPSDQVVTGFGLAKNALYVESRDGVVGVLSRIAYTPGASAERVALPQEGTIATESIDWRLDGLVLSLGSWIRDSGYYAADFTPNRVEDTGLQEPGPYGAPAGLVAREVRVKSYDGTEVPLSIVYPKEIKMDGSNPTHLYGYGAYGITDEPAYAPRLLAWYELGGIRATCHVRGGGVYGEQWHLAGKQATKPNTWKDLIACAEYLIHEGYTSTPKLAIHGGSAGGILIGRAMTERPDLFAVAIPEVGVLNALRAETTANGVPNIPEFGTVKVEEQFHALLEMDALAHVKDGVAYPATLLIHGMNDPRVPVWESMKMAARLQAATSSGKPVLLRLEFDAGHGVGSTKTQREEEYADLWSFMLWQFGDVRFQPAK